MEYDLIFQKQQQTYLDGTLNSLQSRLTLLNKFESVFKQFIPDLYLAILQDLHKTQRQTELSEIQPVLHELHYLKTNLKQLIKPTKVPQPMMFQNAVSQLVPKPIGPVLIIAPFNYPINLALIPVISAFAAGCPVTLKASPQTPQLMKVFDQIASNFGQEVFVTFSDQNQLLPRPYGCVFFTGSIQVGKIIQSLCSKFLNRTILELGGVNPVFLGHCNKIQAVEQILLGKFMNAGQTCIAPNFICMTEENREVVNMLINKLKVYDSDEHVCKIINREKFEYLDGICKKSKVLYQSTIRSDENLMFPHSIIEVDKDDEILRNELFGNVLPVVYFRSLNDAINWYRTTFYVPNLQCRPLSAYLFTEKKYEQEYFLERISAGTLSINQILLFQVSNMPFGGVGESGQGKYHGKESFDAFTHYQPMLWVQKHKMMGFGYKLNSFAAKSSIPPMKRIPDAFSNMSLRMHSISCVKISKITLIVLLVVWAVSVSIALGVILTK